MEKYIKVKNKKLGTTNEPKAPYLDFEGNYCNLKVSTIEDYDIYFDKVYYKENNIIIIPKRDFIYQTNASTGEILSGLYNYSWRNFGNKNSGFNPNNYPECMINEDPKTFKRDNGDHVIRGMYKLPQPYLDELTNIKPIGSAQSAFAYLYCLTTLNGVEKTWDTSEITDMGGMFRELGYHSPDADTSLGNSYNIHSKYQPGTLDLSNWDFSNVTDVDYMFNWTRFKIISDKPLDLKNVNILGMFRSYLYKTIPQLDTTNVTNMSQMFYNSYIANIPKLNTSKVNNMKSMFYGCINLPPVFPWVINCSSITNAENMSSIFTSTPVTKVYLYNVNENIKQNITSTLLKGTSSLTIYFVDSPDIEIDSSLKISNTNYKISNILGTERTYLYDDIDIQGLTTCNLMFSDCSKLIEIPEFDTSNVTDMTGMFKYCRKAKNIPHFNTSNVTNMTEMFHTCGSLIDIPLLDTSNVTNMVSMFHACVHLKTIPLLDTSKVNNMSKMFYYCYELITIPKLNTGNVTSMAEMFHYCTLLTSIPQIDTSNVTNMVSMFRNCKNLTIISELDTSKVTDMRQMFFGCASLPSEFPWPIDCSSISNADYIKSIFEESSVTKVQLKNVKEELKSNVTSKNLKNNDTLTIEFIS